MKNVRGSPPYYQNTFYELLAMIRQLGTPTWFFTLSAADMKWPDVIQTIARQYGVIYTDDQVAAKISQIGSGVTQLLLLDTTNTDLIPSSKNS